MNTFVETLKAIEVGDLGTFELPDCTPPDYISRCGAGDSCRGLADYSVYKSCGRAACQWLPRPDAGESAYEA